MKHERNMVFTPIKFCVKNFYFPDEYSSHNYKYVFILTEQGLPPPPPSNNPWTYATCYFNETGSNVRGRVDMRQSVSFLFFYFFIVFFLIQAYVSIVATL